MLGLVEQMVHLNKLGGPPDKGHLANVEANAVPPGPILSAVSCRIEVPSHDMLAS